MTAARTDNAPDHPRRSDHSPLARPPARLTASMQPQCSAVGRLYPGVLPPMMSLEVRAVTTPGGRPAGSVAPGRAVCGPGVGGSPPTPGRRAVRADDEKCDFNGVSIRSSNYLARSAAAPRSAAETDRLRRMRDVPAGGDHVT